VNAVASILPIEGVSEELLRALNERFRQLSQESTSTTSGSVAGLVFTHANRASANLTAVGTYGTESDRGVVYQVQSVGSSKAWVYISGQFKAAFADRPTDLGSNDAGFLWHVSDYAHCTAVDRNGLGIRRRDGRLLRVSRGGTGWERLGTVRWVRHALPAHHGGSRFGSGDHTAEPHRNAGLLEGGSRVCCDD
jgi:hypothetical protein